MPYIDTINVGGTNYDIGGGGHVIEDASGTELTQRDTLQIAGTLKATDDSTNEKTVISDAAEEVEWSVWNEMTEEERDAYSAGKKIDIVNVPGADGTIDADLMTLLWTNPSPSAAFAAQTISLDLSEYDFVFIEHGYISSNVIIPVGGSYYTRPAIFGSAANAWFVAYRNVTVSTTGVTFSQNVRWLNNSASYSLNDTDTIPVRIYGIKKTINLKINAIASDVSTSASKCMLSDGETSVEDEIKGLKNDNFGTMVDLLQYSSASNTYTFPNDGYVDIHAGNTSGVSLAAVIYGKNSSADKYIAISSYSVPTQQAGVGAATHSTVPVKKGMRVYVSASGSSSSLYAKFVPLV